MLSPEADSLLRKHPGKNEGLVKDGIKILGQLGKGVILIVDYFRETGYPLPGRI
jgi:hypothetical protein